MRAGPSAGRPAGPRVDTVPPTARGGQATAQHLLVTADGLHALGILLVALTLLFAVASAVHERHATIQAAQQQAALLARVLEEHATRSIDSASLTLAALGDSLAADAAGGSPRIGQMLRETLAHATLLRSVAVVDRQGTVLASTAAGLEGRRLQMRRLGPLPAPGSDLIGNFVTARDLSALADGEASDVRKGVGFVPIVRALTGERRNLLLVGAVNPDAIGNHQQLTLGADGGVAMLVSLQGRVLAATSDLPQAPGDLLPALPALTRHLPSVEHGSYLGEGALGADTVVAFRASRTRPHFVQVERPLGAVLEGWKADSIRLGAGALVLAAVLLLVTRVAARSQRERELAQEAVADREREMSIIVGRMQELIFRTDVEGRLLFVNPHWQTVSQVPTDQALFQPLADLVAVPSRPTVAGLLAPDGPPGQRHAQVSIATGSAARQFDVHVTPLYEGTTLVGFAGSAVDVTDRLAGQARLREQLAFTELLFEMLPLPVSMLDTQGRFVMINRAWEAFTGRGRDEALGQSPQWLSAEEADVHDAQDRRLLVAGGTTQYEASRVMPDGSRRDLAITKALVPGPGGRPAGVLVAFMDVTESRKVERAVREARDAAEEASRAKSEFIANISHELRTPLQSIIGFSELGQVRGRDAPKLASMFGDIHGAGQRMLALVNDLLDVAKIESTVGTFHLERTDLRPLARDVVRELEPLLAARQLRVDIDLGDMPLVAKVDPMRLQQVVRNVMANAIRFSQPGHAIDLRGELTAANEVHLSVRDRGPGIPPGELELIFEAFVQSSKTKDGSGGTGLGLAICRKIVDAHGGRISAANAPDGGSVFHVLLPARGFAETQPGGL